MHRRTLLSIGALTAALLAVPALPAVAEAPALSGTVRLAGDSRAGVPVAWFAAGGTVVTSTLTDSSGRYSLPAPPAGTRYLVAVNVAAVQTRPRAAVPGFLATYLGDGATTRLAAPLVTPATADGGDRTADVDVRPATGLSGRHEAFAGRVVRLLTASGTETATTTASRTGAWSFQVAPGVYRIAADSTRSWTAYRSQAFPVGSTAVVKRSAPTRTAVLQGRVTVRGKAVAGVPVRWTGPFEGDEAPERLVRTDSRGRYVLSALVPGRFVVRYGNDGDQNDTSPYVRRSATRTLSPGERETVDVALTRGASVTATVDTSTGARRWSTLLTRDGRVVRTTARTAYATSSRNTLHLRGLPGGTYVLRATDGTRSLMRTLRLTTGAVRSLGRVRTTAAALTLSGRGPAGALVSAQQGSVLGSTQVAADGTYRIPGLLPGTYSVSTVGAGGAGTTVRRTITRSTVLDVALGAPLPDGTARSVTGTVLAGSVPVPLADVVLADGPDLLVVDGRFQDAVVRVGTHRVASVRALGTALLPRATPYFLTWPGPDIRVVPGADTDLGTVTLGVGG